jgi:hypothetical protein
LAICNRSLTPSQAAVIALFRVINRYVGENGTKSPSISVRCHRGGKKKKNAATQSWLSDGQISLRAYFSLYVPVW